MNFLLETLRLGLSNLLLHKLRSLLTALGIIFGVAAVITMVAIGEGSKIKVLADIRQLGARNIIIQSVKPPESASAEAREGLMSYGILRSDRRRIETTVGPIENIVALKHVGAHVTEGFNNVPAASVFGTTHDLKKVASLVIDRGRYLSDADHQQLTNVAVIGAEVAKQLFPLKDPLGATFKVDEQVFKVVGVLHEIGLSAGRGSALVGRNINYDVHIPMATATARFGDQTIKRSSGNIEATKVELSELIIQVPHEKDVIHVARQIELLLETDHADQPDVTTIVPLELLKQAESAQQTFNYLMIAIASISLLVGGIGIMNIMLASVTERTREIGIRRALGATQKHIISQFLVETTVLSGVGGIIGVGLGLGTTIAFVLLQSWASWFEQMARPQLTGWSIIVSFIVATTVGIVFGLYPAIQASRQDPIVALRHD
jgi:putative ABC transport system permease protein